MTSCYCRWVDCSAWSPRVDLTSWHQSRCKRYLSCSSQVTIAQVISRNQRRSWWWWGGAWDWSRARLIYSINTSRCSCPKRLSVTSLSDSLLDFYCSRLSLPSLQLRHRQGSYWPHAMSICSIWRSCTQHWAPIRHCLGLGLNCDFMRYWWKRLLTSFHLRRVSESNSLKPLLTPP